MYLILFSTRKRLKILIFSLTCFLILLFFGVFHHPLEKDFYTEFHYPYDGDIEDIVLKLKNNQTPHVPPINNYNFYYYKTCEQKCADISDLRLIYIVKSAPQNFPQRQAIRSSWGFQRRFSDVEIRTVFLVGLSDNAKYQVSINAEYERYHDIVQANYTDSYFNNTFKTMSGFQWAMTYCKSAKFFMFVDDDYYVSTKNVLRFVRFPTNYPSRSVDKDLLRRPLENIEFDLSDEVRLYTGYALVSSPLRHYISKWYISLEEYPYHMWPPYVSAGAYILSNTALIDLYYASLYTKHFRFDDIYVAILAYKTKIEPFHSEYFHFYKKPYYKFDYENVIASHGYGNPKELVTVWSEQKSMGNA